MTDVDSPLKEFCSTKFPVNLNGETSEFYRIVKIPFIDEAKLRQALESRDFALTADELQSNTFGSMTLFFCAERPLSLNRLKVHITGQTPWGFIERIPVQPTDIRNSFEFVYTQHEIPPRVNLLLLLPGVSLPPWTFDVGRCDARTW
jgi:hypothetical protein